MRRRGARARRALAGCCARRAAGACVLRCPAAGRPAARPRRRARARGRARRRRPPRCARSPGGRIRDGRVDGSELVARRRGRGRAPFGASAAVAVVGAACAAPACSPGAALGAACRRGLEAGEELALGGSAAAGRRPRPTRIARPASTSPPTCAAAGSPASSCSTRRARPVGGGAGVAGLLDRMRAGPSAPWRRACPRTGRRCCAAWCSARTSGSTSATRDDLRDAGLAHLLAVSGQNVMLLAALALPLLALARARAARRGGSALLGLVALYVPLAGAGPSLQRAGVMGVAGHRGDGALAAGVALVRAAAGGRRRRCAQPARVRPTPAGSSRSRRSPGSCGRACRCGGAAAAAASCAERSTRRGTGPRPPPPPAVRARSRTGVADHGRRHARHRAAARASTSAPCRSPACRRTCSRCRRWRPRCGWACSRPRSASWPRLLPGAAALAELLGRSPAAGRLPRRPRRALRRPPGRTLGLPLLAGVGASAAYALLAACSPLPGLGAPTRAPHGAPSACRSRGAAWRALRAARRGAVAAALAAVARARHRRVLAAPAPPDRLTVRFLDVGQGDATLIQHPDGTAVLFDGGPPEGGVARLLRRAGVRPARPRRRDPRLARPPRRSRRRAASGSRSALLLDGGDGTAIRASGARRGAPTRRGVRAHPGRRAAEPRAPAGLPSASCRPPPRPPGPRARGPEPARRGGDRQLAAASTCCCPPTPRARRCCRSTSRTSTR